MEQSKRTERELKFANTLLTARYSEDKEMQMQLENTLIKNYIDELKSLRIKHFEVSEKLSERDSECQILRSRLANVKDKYTRVKEERNKAW